MLVDEMPHGRLKSSGYGKDLSMYALEDYTVPRHVLVRLLGISASATAQPILQIHDLSRVFGGIVAVKDFQP